MIEDKKFEEYKQRQIEELRKQLSTSDLNDTIESDDWNERLIRNYKNYQNVIIKDKADNEHAISKNYFQKRFFTILHNGQFLIGSEYETDTYEKLPDGTKKINKGKRKSSKDIEKSLMTPNAFHQNYEHLNYNESEGNKNLTKYYSKDWITSSTRRKYDDGFTFDPKMSKTAKYNKFQGFAIKPEKNDCNLIIKMIEDNYFPVENYIKTNDRAENIDFFFQYLSHLINKPWELPQVALVIRSFAEGTGKGTLWERIIAPLIGHDLYIDTSKMSKITGQFNSSIRNKLVVGINEALYSGNRADNQEVRNLITNKYIGIENKRVDLDENVINYIRLIILSNEETPVHQSATQRRFFNVLCSTAFIQDSNYWDALFEQINNGGIAGFHQYLIDIHRPDFSPFRELKSLNGSYNLGLDMIKSGESALEIFLDEYFENFEGRQVETQSLYISYTMFCREDENKFKKKENSKSAFYKRVEQLTGVDRKHSNGEKFDFRNIKKIKENLSKRFKQF